MRRRSCGNPCQIDDDISFSRESSVRLVAVNSTRSSIHSVHENPHAYSNCYMEEENASSKSTHFNPSLTRSNSPDMCNASRIREDSSPTRSDPNSHLISLQNSRASALSPKSSLTTLPQAGVSLLPALSSGPAYLRSRSGTDLDCTFDPTRSQSSVSGASVDSGHKNSITSIQTTEKFTNKWPRPQSLRTLNLNRSAKGWRNRKNVIQETVSELEEGYSLGLDKIDKWTRFKWSLMVSVISVLCYGTGSMICAILTWFRTWSHADVMYVADNDVLILITLAASILMLTALLGLTGTLLNSRPILATYTLLLWPALISMLAVGYTSYKRYAFSLDRKINFSWSQYYTPLGRLMIQSSLRCCGYYDPLHEATISNKCYPRTPLPGCKGKLYRFERENLSLIWSTTFSLVFLHLINIVVALLCSNHVTNVFGKRITPKRYRLNEQDLKTDAEKIRSQIGRMRPTYSRASSSSVFREDREERMPLLTDSAQYTNSG